MGVESGDGEERFWEVNKRQMAWGSIFLKFNK
jgi:hypothetical protein